MSSMESFSHALEGFNDALLRNLLVNQLIAAVQGMVFYVFLGVLLCRFAGRLGHLRPWLPFVPLAGRSLLLISLRGDRSFQLFHGRVRIAGRKRLAVFLVAIILLDSTLYVSLLLLFSHASPHRPYLVLLMLAVESVWLLCRAFQVPFMWKLHYDFYMTYRPGAPTNLLMSILSLFIPPVRIVVYWMLCRGQEQTLHLEGGTPDGPN